MWRRVRAGLRPRQEDKAASELRFWQERRAAEGRLANEHYVSLYTVQFGLDRSFFAGKSILDIGCGPRGSLEWATEATERVGLDPLADDYRQLGIDDHAMTYVSSGAERIPFADGHFDVVTSLNSLDHVDDVEATLQEIARVVRAGGAFLLEVEVGHEPTPTEPISIWFDVLDDLAQWFDLVTERRFEMPQGHFVHTAWSKGVPFREDEGRHAGVLVAHLQRR